MFRLHETTQRRVCRWAFVVLCAAPTLAVAAWIVHSHRPWRLQDEQRRLSAALRVDVRLADWREPRPDAVRTASVELGDLTGPLGFAKLSKLEHRRVGDIAWLNAHAVVIDVGRLHMLATRLPLWLADLEERELRFRCQRLTLHDPESNASTTYRDVEAVIRDGGRLVQLVARGDSDAANAPQFRASLVCPTDDATGDPIPLATLDAADAPLPLWLLSTFAPVGGGWGDEATFAGTVRLEFASDGCRGVAAGRLRDLELSAIATAAGSHRAEGRASVELQELRWRGSQIERVAGSVRAENVRVSQSVVKSAIEQLFCGRVGGGSAPDSSVGELVAVDSVSCRFLLDAEGLALTGTLPATAGIPAGSIAQAAGRPLLDTPPFRLHPSAWVQFVSGHTTGWVPATREAVDAAARLPLPTASDRADRSQGEGDAELP
jgi:hypothetical protein